MRLFNCIIVDDEPIAHRILERYLKEVRNVNIIGSFYNTIDAHEFLQHQKVDLLFLDIKMPEEDGLSLLKKLAEKPITILVTAMLDHALEAYDLDVIDYLVKPIRPERFKQALEKATEFLRMQTQEYSLALENRSDKFITIKLGREKMQVDTDTITHIQSVKDYMLIYTGSTKHLIRSTTAKMLDILPEQFVRVHKSFIVNKSRIKKIGVTRLEIEEFVIPLGNKYKGLLY